MPAWDHPRRVVGGPYGYAKFCWNWQCRFEDIRLSVLSEFGWKMPIYSRFWGCFGGKYGIKQKLFVVLSM